MLELRTNLQSFYQPILLLIFMSLQTVTLAQMSILPDRANRRYDIGETINFRVTGAANGTVNYKIKHTIIDTLTLFGSGTVSVINGEATIPFSPREAGFLVCQIKQNADSAYTGVSVSSEKLQLLEAGPSDFEAFWANQKAAVRAVPMDIHLTFVRTSIFATKALSNIFSFDIGIVDGRRAYGYMVVPVGTVAAYPAVFIMPSFGHVANLVTDDPTLAERAGVISIFLSPHNNPPNVTSNSADYLTDGLASPSTYYIKYALLGAVKMMDYLQTRPDFNGQIAALGISQGGGLAALVASIDNRVTVLAQSYSGFSNEVAAKYSQPSSFPFSYHTAYTSTLSREAILNTMKYYDPIYALSHFKGVSWNVTSLKDDVCPPQAVMTGFNQVRGQRIIQYVFDKLHTEGPDEFYNSDPNLSIYALFRRHFPNCRYAPWPYNPSTTGYVIDVGKDTVLVGNTLQLKGFVGMDNYELADLPVRWEKVEGTGTVTFSNQYNRNTTATFSQTGVYRLRFLADDFTNVANKKYFTLSNEIIVTVNSLVPIELVSFNGKIQDKTNELTWTTASELNNKGFDIERSEDTKRWQTLDFVKGIGTSNQLNTYNFTDRDPLSISYYRLKQIDFNGDFKYADIISLIRHDNKDVQIFPNPVGDILTIRRDNTDNSDIKIYDIFGRIQLSETTQNIETALNISHLAKGNYFIEIKNGALITTKKLIKY